MRTFDITFEITVSVQAESEESIDFDEAATDAIITMQNEGAANFAKGVKEQGTTPFPDGVAGFGREDYENVIEELDYPEFTEEQLRRLVNYSWRKWDCSVSMSSWEQLDLIINDFAAENGIERKEEEGGL